MSDIPWEGDTIQGGANGAGLWYLENGKFLQWLWDGKQVMLEPGQSLTATGAHPIDSLLGQLFELKNYRRKGSRTIYRTRDEALGKGDIGNALGNLFTFSPDNVVEQVQYVRASDVLVIPYSQHQGNVDKSSDYSLEQLDKNTVEQQLQEAVYGPNPSIPRHTQLLKNEGVWYAYWANGYHAPVGVFLQQPVTTQLSNTTKDLRSNATDPGKNNDGGNGGGTITIPAYLYWVLGSVFGVSLIVLVSQKLKRKQ